MTLKPSTIACIALGSITGSLALSFAVQKGMEAYYGPEFKEACQWYRETARGR